MACDMVLCPLVYQPWFGIERDSKRGGSHATRHKKYASHVMIERGTSRDIIMDKRRIHNLGRSNGLLSGGSAKVLQGFYRVCGIKNAKVGQQARIHP